MKDFLFFENLEEYIMCLFFYDSGDLKSIWVKVFIQLETM
jgi:hypothetical protein